MAEQDPFDCAMSEFAEVLNFIEKNKNQLINKEISLDVERQIESLEKEVQAFVVETEELLAVGGGKEVDIRQAQEEIPETLPGDQREALKRAQAMKRQLMKMREEFAADAPLPKQEPGAHPKGKKGKKLSKAAHRKKYKRLGGKQDWKPM